MEKDEEVVKNVAGWLLARHPGHGTDRRKVRSGFNGEEAWVFLVGDKSELLCWWIGVVIGVIGVIGNIFYGG